MCKHFCISNYYSLTNQTVDSLDILDFAFFQKSYFANIDVFVSMPFCHDVVKLTSGKNSSVYEISYSSFYCLAFIVLLGKVVLVLLRQKYRETF